MVEIINIWGGYEEIIFNRLCFLFLRYGFIGFRRRESYGFCRRFHHQYDG